jgi:hypothetical protein
VVMPFSPHLAVTATFIRNGTGRPLLFGVDSGEIWFLYFGVLQCEAPNS